MLVAPALDEDVQHDPVLIHCAPEPVLLPRDLHGNLVEVPCISSTRQPAVDLVCEFVHCTNRRFARYHTYPIRRTEVSDTKKTSQSAREGFEQVREAGKTAVDSTVRSSKEALGRAENVLNRTVDDAGAIGSSMA